MSGPSLPSANSQDPHQASPAFVIHSDMASGNDASPTPTSSASRTKHAITSSDGPVPLTTNKLANTQAKLGRDQVAHKKLKIDHGPPLAKPDASSSSMDSILAKLTEQQALLQKQKNTLSAQADHDFQEKDDSTPGSELLTPATDSFSITPHDDSADDVLTSKQDPVEVLRLKKELDDAKNKIARQERELSQTRFVKQALGQPSAMSANVSVPVTTRLDPGRGMGNNMGNDLDNMHASNRLMSDDAQSEFSDVLSATGFNRAQTYWTPNGPGFQGEASSSMGYTNFPQQQNSIWSQQVNRPWNTKTFGQPMQPGPSMMMQPPPQQQVRTFSGPASPNAGLTGNFVQDLAAPQGNIGLRRSNTHNSRGGSNYGPNRGNQWENYGMGSEFSSMTSMTPASNYPPMGMFQAPMSYQPRPIGTPLSPTAAEFNFGNVPNNHWNPAPPTSPGQTYVSPMEPLNYRRLLDRSVTCNWKYIVDKIVCNNDQQASIFLQQKLKVGTAEQKFEIVDAIVAQAYPLMINRFGNFLIQRCFEHGTPEQVRAIANAIRGNTLSLSMDAFGCHVVQKAFDAVDEEYKAVFVHELLRRIPETVIHRYACHVWQKLFELRWNDSPPQIMKYVNEALRGMWHEVALGETGSLVVQNIFENCLEEDKRPCINEVLASIDIVAHGQFGNWCIQHICEHGAPADRSRAIDHVLRYATEYSMDQFASKVVEKCLKIGGSEFLERYLERVCEGRSDRPRIPLIDIASDQYGNYLVQYILTNASTQHRELVAAHIRKHMVSLRGSKFGSRVGMLCCNPAYSTRPGPGVGPPVNRFNGPNNMPNSRFGGNYR